MKLLIDKHWLAAYTTTSVVPVCLCILKGLLRKVKVVIRLKIGLRQCSKSFYFIHNLPLKVVAQNPTIV